MSPNLSVRSNTPNERTLVLTPSPNFTPLRLTKATVGQIRARLVAPSVRLGKQIIVHYGVNAVSLQGETIRVELVSDDIWSTVEQPIIELVEHFLQAGSDEPEEIGAQFKASHRRSRVAALS